MKDLLTVSKNVVIPSAYALTIAEFTTLKNKELAAVFFYADHNSPYAVYDKGERIKKNRKKILKLNTPQKLEEQ